MQQGEVQVSKDTVIAIMEQEIAELTGRVRFLRAALAESQQREAQASAPRAKYSVHEADAQPSEG